METIGYLLTVVIGILIGLFGGGGSILTVPVLVYLFLIPTTLSTTYSLALVSISSLIAATPHIINKQLSFNRIIQFGVPSLLSLYTVRAFVLPSIPNEFHLFGFNIQKDVFMIVFFSIIMLIAGFFMIRNTKQGTQEVDGDHNPKTLIIAGLLEGAITGIVGAGGGFIIVPVLMFFGKLSMKQAVANSLFIIGVKSLIGFMGSHDMLELDFKFLLLLLTIALVGMTIGMRLNKKMDSKKLKPIFGYFVIGMGVFILIKELLVS